MDITEQYIRFKRLAAPLGCFVAAIFMIYRGHTFGNNGTEFSLIVPVMCVMTALSLLVTGLALALRPEAQPE